MEQIEKEKDNIILQSIVKYGFEAIPQDYVFLNRYSMFNIYIEIVNSSTSGRSTKHLEGAVKKHAALQLSDDCKFTAFRAYRETHGAKETKDLLNNNSFYWKTLLNILKKNKI